MEMQYLISKPMINNIIVYNLNLRYSIETINEIFTTLFISQEFLSRESGQNDQMNHFVYLVCILVISFVR